jgi:hypothetical protein
LVKKSKKIIQSFFLVWNWTPEAEKDAKEAFDTAFELNIPFYDSGN